MLSGEDGIISVDGEVISTEVSEGGKDSRWEITEEAKDGEEEEEVDGDVEEGIKDLLHLKNN